MRCVTGEQNAPLLPPGRHAGVKAVDCLANEGQVRVFGHPFGNPAAEAGVVEDLIVPVAGAEHELITQRPAWAGQTYGGPPRIAVRARMTQRQLSLGQIHDQPSFRVGVAVERDLT
jgi:hypothetical protein